MNGNDERGLDPVDTQGNNVVASVPNTSHSTFKIDSLSIKLGIVKEKGDAQKCRHFSIRGYVSGMRETGRSNLLPFIEELPPMDVPNFRYWLCQMCLQNSGTASSLHETTPSVSGCNQCVLQPFAIPQNRAGVAVLPFGEGTSGLKPANSKNDDESILSALGANRGQSSQDIPASVAVSQEVTNDAAEGNTGLSGQKETIDSIVHEDPQQTSPENQPIQQDQQNDYPNGHPRRKTRKVRLLKELLTVQKQTKENVTPFLGVRACSTSAPSSQPKRKMLHDQVQDQDQDQDQRPDVTTPGHTRQKAKVSKGNEVSKNNVVEHSKDPGIGEGGETINKFQWNKVGTQRSSILSRAGNDTETTWRSIFSDMGRTDNNQVGTRLNFGVSQEKAAEPYSNFMAPPKPNKKVNSSKKISSNPPKNIFFGEGSKRLDVAGGSRPNDLPSDTELALGLSLNFDPHSQTQAQARSLPPILNRTSNQDHSRNAGFFFGEPTIAPRIPSDLRSNEGLVPDVSNRYGPGTSFLQDQRPYTQLPYGHQKLDFSDPYKRNIGFGGYSEIPRPHDHQRQENFTIGRSDEREVVELLAKNQYERSLCEPRSRFGNVNMNEGMTTSPHGYFNMMRPTSDNNRGLSFTMFDDLTPSQNRPSSGVWLSDSLPPRHPNSRYQAHAHGHPYLYPSTNSHPPPESFNMYRNAPVSIPFKDKGKNMMNLDLNLVAPNVVEEQNNLDSSYSNEAIPAMQLLSLMDAGKPSRPVNTESRKASTRPLSYSGNPSLLSVGSALHSVFRTDQNAKFPSTQKPRPGASSGSLLFPLSWHATENRNKLVTMETNRSFVPRYELLGTELCTINRNPADFTTPGAENIYMINPDDLVGKGKSSSKVKASVSVNELRRQKKAVKATS